MIWHDWNYCKLWLQKRLHSYDSFDMSHTKPTGHRLSHIVSNLTSDNQLALIVYESSRLKKGHFWDVLLNLSCRWFIQSSKKSKIFILDIRIVHFSVNLNFKRFDWSNDSNQNWKVIHRSPPGNHFWFFKWAINDEFYGFESKHIFSQNPILKPEVLPVTHRVNWKWLIINESLIWFTTGMRKMCFPRKIAFDQYDFIDATDFYLRRRMENA